MTAAIDRFAARAAACFFAVALTAATLAGLDALAQAESKVGIAGTTANASRG